MKILMPLKQNRQHSWKHSCMCVMKPGNTHDQCAVAVGKNKAVKGHFPKKVSHVCTPFLKKGGRRDTCTRLISVKETLE